MSNKVNAYPTLDGIQSIIFTSKASFSNLFSSTKYFSPLPNTQASIQYDISMPLSYLFTEYSMFIDILAC